MHGVGIQLQRIVPSLRGVGLCLAVLVFGFAQPAYSFFPFGAFQEDGDVVFQKWSLDTLDRDNDGDVSGDNDGVLMTIQVGDSGYFNGEIPTIIDAFNVWENLPGAYVAFTFTAPITDSIPFGATDGFNSVTIFGADGVDGIDSESVAGVNVSFSFIEDGFIAVPGTDFIVEARGGQIFETDIVVGASNFRNELNETNNLKTLKGILVHEIGHGIGLGHNPMHNFNNIDDVLSGAEDEEEDLFQLEEDPVLSIRDGSGVLRIVGATPTMFPILFGTLNTLTEQFEIGQDTLAIDDIAAAHFLYPRQGQVDDYFTVNQQARRSIPSLEGVPSPHVAGALITAYVDHDNNAGTSRIPVVSSMSGLYTNGSNNGNLDLDGRFSLFGLPKKLESVGGELFDATYTFSMTRIGDVIPFQPPSMIDTMHNTNGDVDARADSIYDTSFISEVFNENGNLLDSTLSLSGGTPLKYDTLRRQIVSVDSGRTLDQILAGAKPMFGTSPTQSTCPLDIILGGTVTTGTDTTGGLELPGRLTIPTPELGMAASVRSFRDVWLFKNAIGRTLVDGYYRVAPYVARFLSSHKVVTQSLRGAIDVGSIYWREALAFWAIVVTLVALAWSRGRKRGSRFLLRWIGAAAILFACIPAQATTIKLESTAQLTDRSSDIVQGTVLSQRTYLGSNGKILTDVVISVGKVVKGTANKQSTITLTLLGGNLNGFVARVPGLPKFVTDEEVIVFLKESKSKGLVVTGLEQGKLTVHTDEKTGKKFVNSKSLRSKRGLPTAKRTDPEKAIEKDEDGDLVEPEGLVSVEQYTAYLRAIVNKQARAQE